jgi:hypothetical protein
MAGLVEGGDLGHRFRLFGLFGEGRDGGTGLGCAGVLNGEKIGGGIGDGQQAAEGDGVGGGGFFGRDDPSEQVVR